MRGEGAESGVQRRAGSVSGGETDKQRTKLKKGKGQAARTHGLS
jgi:hypothetical protein